MSALVVLLVGLAAGVAVQRTGKIGPDAWHAVTFWVLNIALPALALRVMHEVRFPASLGAVVAVPYLLFAVTAALYVALARPLRLRREVVAALVATSATANTSFVGIPMVTAFFSADDVPIAVIVDQLGSFVLLSTVVTALVSVAGEQSSRVTPRAMARRVLLAPPLLALAAGLALRPVAYPGWLTEVLTRLGDTLTPLALFAIGLQLDVSAARRWWRELAVGLVVKLLVAPALVVAAYALFGSLDDRAIQVALFEATMPPMVAGALMASRHNLATPLPSLLVGVGVPLSMFTCAGWSVLLQS
ncbi:AEC family transporter [Frankia sp. CNm7]|uniref:AEC family transporter n=1 Tax=Frankia nepalensis TaxID=1836974 RepID=A0A937UQM6_9ACTN|nr:AEC family transporter [Frankia nepalensis]MBL7494996.1 AEC family transporter [Frankia nepalensis]MBL7514693.1 AEC family transporter [Frankia nepalensis]MBL7521956.1 AEC family transporter [Frankia nepalensis]MBL7631994.1 AEC family transporter [Frankia nepalensis]